MVKLGVLVIGPQKISGGLRKVRRPVIFSGCRDLRRRGRILIKGKRGAKVRGFGGFVQKFAFVGLEFRLDACDGGFKFDDRLFQRVSLLGPARADLASVVHPEGRCQNQLVHRRCRRRLRQPCVL